VLGVIPQALSMTPSMDAWAALSMTPSMDADTRECIAWVMPFRFFLNHFFKFAFRLLP
jgi:hypothetical protein